MQEAEEQDTCRICSGPAEENQPLFHPCKCSGTIRYIHQDCLTTWLAHSNKKSCDVCKHPYSFTKVYADDMPSTLPPLLVLRRLIQQLFVGIFFVLRAIMVGTIWLAVLPYATVRTWRMYFFMGDAAAWWISNVQRPVVNATAPIYAATSTSQTTKSAATTLFAHLSTHPAWLALSADIFMGQIIASLIVLTFVAIFLLREWISQNARPGVFEDEELPPPDPNRPQVPQQGRRAVRVPVDQQQLQAALARRQVETMRALDEMRARDGVHGHLVGDERIHGRTPLERPPRKKREDGQAAFDSRATRRLLAPQNHGDYGEEDGAYDPEDERQRRHSFSRRVFAARVAGARRKAALAAAGQPPIVPAVPGTSRFEFNFRRPEDTDSADNAVAPSATPSTSQAPNLSAILPPVTIDPPKDNIPFSLGSFASAPPFSLTASTPGLVQTSPNGTSIGVPFHPPLSVTTSEPSLPLPPPYSEEDMNPPSPSPASPTTLNAVLEPRPPQVFSFTISDADAGPSHPPIQGPPEQSPSGSTANGKVKAEVLDDDEVLGGSMSDYFASDLEDEDHIKEEQEVVEEGDETLVPKAEDEGDWPAHDEEDDGQEHESEEDEDAEGEEQHEIDSDDSEDEEDDDDNPWRPVEVRAVPAQNGANRPGNAAGAPAAAPANAAAAADGGLQEDIQPDVEDDMEGAMEAIGMRGPLHGVLQNAALMIFVLDTAIGLGIFVPFTIGKLTALLSLNPPRFFQILHLPIKAIRVVTDPVVDGIAYVLVHFLLPPLIRTTKSSAGPFIERYLPFLNASPREITPANNSTNFVTVFTSRLTEFATTSYEKISAWSLALPTEPPLEESTISKYSAQVWDKAEPYFAILGKHVRLSSDRFKVSWVKMSIGGGPAERTFAILLGYVVAGFALAIYLNLLTVGNAKSANRAIRSAVRQQLLVLKVAAFIFIELVTFPLTCGIILDLCTVVFFPSAPLNSRMVFFKQAPLTAVFYHWVAGTMFMYTFAIVLSGCRSVMRVGAMWFIKDPQDQNSHPIRDILDRPTFTQLKKISISGCMYAVVVACFVGSMSILLSLGKLSILPFRWKNREPISDVPVDLLFLHMVLPYTMQYFRPKKPLRKFSTFLWKWLASRLRLTSYFFGDRTADEEKATSWWRVISTKPPTTKDTDGTFRRVPATDSVALPRDMRATVEVSAYGMAINEEAQILMNKQNAEVLKAKKRITDEFIVVYMPPYFRYRIFVFIACLWVIGIAVLGASIAVPISLGRSFFQIFTPKELHDGYSLIVGFYITWAAYLIVAWIDRLDKRRKRSEGSRTADLPLLVAKRGLAWAAKVGFMGFWLGVVIPTLIATVVDLYIITPIRLQLQPDWVPTVRVVDNWALGLLYTKIALHVTRIRRPARNGQGQERVYELPTRISEGVQHLINNGWTQPDPIQASREVILPMVGGLSAMILFPGAILRGIQYFMPHVKFGNRFLFDKVYPLIFAFAGLARSAVVLDEKVASWSQTIRDKEFLVEMRLRNHEPEREGSSSSAESIRTDTSGANEN